MGWEEASKDNSILAEGSKLHVHVDVSSKAGGGCACVCVSTQ